MGNQAVKFTSETSVGAVPTLGVGRVATTGNVFFVNSNTGVATNSGLSPDAPINSLANALSVCTANAADIIMLMPGHAETIIANTEITIEGVTIMGMGNGDNRPVFTFGTDTAADLEVKADNVTIDNIVFKCGIDNQAAFIESIKAYTVIKNCLFLEGSSAQCLEAINFSNANCDYCKVLHCEFVSATDGADNAITIGAALDKLEIAYCHVHGDYDDACIHNPTGNVATRLFIHDNVLANVASGQHAIELVSTCTGELWNNMLYTDSAATSLDPGGMVCAGNEHAMGADLASVEIPQTDIEGGQLVTYATATTPQGADATLFTVTGGQVEVLALCGEVTTVIESATNVSRLKFNPTGTGSDVVLCQDLEWNGAAAGTLFTITGNPNDPMQSGVWYGFGLSNTIILGPGVIELECDGSTTGNVGWQLLYRPLEAGAKVA